MNLFKFFIPSGATKEITGVETWVVEWTKRIGEFSSDTRRCYQHFINRDEAIAFKESIENAHKLIGNTSGIGVLITK